MDLREQGSPQGSLPLPSHNAFWRILRIPQDQNLEFQYFGIFCSIRTCPGWPLSAAPRARFRGKPRECLPMPSHFSPVRLVSGRSHFSPVRLVSALSGRTLRIQFPTWAKKPQRHWGTYLRAEKRGAHRRDREHIFPMPSTPLWPFVTFCEPFPPPSSGMRCSTTFVPPPRSLL